MEKSSWLYFGGKIKAFVWIPAAISILMFQNIIVEFSVDILVYTFSYANNTIVKMHPFRSYVYIKLSSALTSSNLYSRYIHSCLKSNHEIRVVHFCQCFNVNLIRSFNDAHALYLLHMYALFFSRLEEN